MISIIQLREAIAEIVSTIPEIKKVRYIVTDDQFADYLDKHKEADNTMLLCLVPTYQSFGENEDLTGYFSYLQFFIVDKVDYKTHRNEDDFTQIFIDTQKITMDFVSGLFDYQKDECYLFGNLQYNSLVIRPVNNRAHCNGWEIQVDDKTYSAIDGSTW